jgi:hypothetical protein
LQRARFFVQAVLYSNPKPQSLFRHWIQGIVKVRPWANASITSLRRQPQDRQMRSPPRRKQKSTVSRPMLRRISRRKAANCQRHCQIRRNRHLMQFCPYQHPTKEQLLDSAKVRSNGTARCRDCVKPRRSLTLATNLSKQRKNLATKVLPSSHRRNPHRKSRKHLTLMPTRSLPTMALLTARKAKSLNPVRIDPYRKRVLFLKRNSGRKLNATTQ